MGMLSWLTSVLLAAGAPEAPRSVAVVPLVAKRLPKETVAVLDDLLLTSIAQLKGYRALGPSDINAMLGVEKMKQTLGCDDVSCAAELGGALGVDLLVTGTVSKLGKTVIVTLSLVDSRAHTVIRRAKAQVEDVEEAYARAIDQAACSLFEGTGCGPAPPSAGTPAAPVTSIARAEPSLEGYRELEDGRVSRTESAFGWREAVRACVVARDQHRPTTLVCDHGGQRVGYELFWNGALAGYEPGWDAAAARGNCAWNARERADRRVECRFDGRYFTQAEPPSVPSGARGRGYELFYGGRLAAAVPGATRDEALSACLRERDALLPSVAVTCDFEGRRLGYELRRDGALVGYEPGWDLGQARANCAWNRETRKDVVTTCSHEGRDL
jgi:TolB-like protein